MNEDLNNLQYWPIRDYRYAQHFQNIQFQDKNLTQTERQLLVAAINEAIADFSSGFALVHSILEDEKDKHDRYHEIDRTIVSVMLFILITSVDSLVASKYFVQTTNDYDKRLFRGKLLVILNEGFKKLYGFKDKNRHLSEWARLSPLLKDFPDIINKQYIELTALLEKHAQSSSWWNEERNLETHIEAEKLYHSRQEEVVESRVMESSMKLFDTLLAINRFLTNMHACLVNSLIAMYKRGELKDE